LSEPDVLGLHRICQDTSIDLIPDCGIVFGRVDPMSRYIFSHPEVNDLQEHWNAGIESDVNEYSERMNGDNPAPNPAAPRQGRLKLVPLLLAQ